MAINFQKTVIIVATIALIVLLTIIGITLYSHKTNVKYPPVVSKCPDYWEISGNKCINVKNLGNNCGKSFDYTSNKFKGSKGDCAKAKFARNCDITWQGITTNSDICKQKN